MRLNSHPAGRHFLQIPGPTNVPDRVLRAMDYPTIDHRGPEFNALAKKYMPKGPGSVFTFGVKGGYEAGIKLVESVRLFSHLANVGDTRSLILHPASTTHRQLTDEQRAASGAGPDVVRLSIGLEDANDLIRDLDTALAG